MSIYRGRNKNEIYLASLLYDAIEDLDIRSVKTLLLEKQADPNLILPNKKISSFHLVIGNDSETFAQNVTLLFLQHGGNPNVQSDDGLTPVHIAAAWGRYEVLSLLLSCGGDPEIRDINNKTPLHYAIEEKFPDCYNLLKIYLPDKKCFKLKDDCKHFNLTLDKILVNNGSTLGEYEIVNEYKTDNIQIERDLKKLHELPASNSNEYVLSWFNANTHTNPQSHRTDPYGTTELSEDSDLKESDRETTKYNIDTKNINFRKVYRKKAAKSPSLKSSLKTSPIVIAKKPNNTISSECREFSKESGINTLLNTVTEFSTNTNLLSSSNSNYLSCADTTPVWHEQNVFSLGEFGAMTNDETDKSVRSVAKSEGISSTGSGDLSFVSVSEIYKYEDHEQGIVLYEKRFLKTPVGAELNNGSIKSYVSSNISSLPETIDYEDIDSDGIRKELTQFGYNPGPITVTTKRIYLKKLKLLRKLPVVATSRDTRIYSSELQKTLNNPEWLKSIALYKALDEKVLNQFSSPDPTKKWREGLIKSSFTYLLLDPRITSNLPSRAEALKPKEVWQIFLSAIFYVGKGKRSRPYSHLYEAANLWNSGQRCSENKKLARILDIWGDSCGVVCLHLFQNTIPVEAYTREAAIIDAIRLENLSNAMHGNFYGISATWSPKEKAMLGVFLLYKAMMIFLNEGERQLCPNDID